MEFLKNIAMAAALSTMLSAGAMASSADGWSTIDDADKLAAGIGYDQKGSKLVLSKANIQAILDDTVTATAGNKPAKRAKLAVIEVVKEAFKQSGVTKDAFLDAIKGNIELDTPGDLTVYVSTTSTGLKDNLVASLLGKLPLESEHETAYKYLEELDKRAGTSYLNEDAKRIQGEISKADSAAKPALVKQLEALKINGKTLVELAKEKQTHKTKFTDDAHFLAVEKLAAEHAKLTEAHAKVNGDLVEANRKLAAGTMTPLDTAIVKAVQEVAADNGFKFDGSNIKTLLEQLADDASSKVALSDELVLARGKIKELEGKLLAAAKATAPASSSSAPAAPATGNATAGIPNAALNGSAQKEKLESKQKDKTPPSSPKSSSSSASASGITAQQEAAARRAALDNGQSESDWKSYVHLYEADGTEK